MTDEEDKSVHKEISHNNVEENDVATDSYVEKGIRTLLIQIFPATSSPFVGYREKLRMMRHAREDARVARSRAVYFARHTRDGELARRLIGSLSNDDGDGNENG